MGVRGVFTFRVLGFRVVVRCKYVVVFNRSAGWCVERMIRKIRVRKSIVKIRVYSVIFK